MLFAGAPAQAASAGTPPPGAVTHHFGPRLLHGFEPERGDREQQTMLPPRKIAWGVLLTLLVVTAPLGVPLLAVGIHQLRSPAWRVRVLVAEAEKHPADARALLDAAEAVQPDSPLVQRAMARWDDRHLHLAAAIRLYTSYLRQVPGDWRTRAAYAAACLRNGRIDEAVAGFTDVLGRSNLSPEARASASAHLAYAHLSAERLEEAGSVLVRVPIADGGLLLPGEQQCVYYTAVVLYLHGDRERAIELVDRLCDLQPEYPELLWTALSMRSRAFHLLLPNAEALAPASPGAAVGALRRVPASPLRCSGCGAPRDDASDRCVTCGVAFSG